MSRVLHAIGGAVVPEPIDIRDTVNQLLRDRGVWEDFVHWNSLWALMPEVAYRIGRCISASVPDAQGRAPLIGQCFVEGAKVIRRWPTSDRTMVLVADALRVMLNRVLDAASYVVVLADGREWRPDIHGPLVDCLAQLDTTVAAVRPREGDCADARLAMHRLLERHVYCIRCSTNLRQSYAQLMGVPGEL